MTSTRPIVECTVFSQRDIALEMVLRNHARLDGIDRVLWLANGVDEATYQTLVHAASQRRQPTTLFRCGRRLPIARAYNHLLATAHDEDDRADCLILQDDVTARPCLPRALQDSQFDLTAAWHDDRPPHRYEVRGLDYVVFMAALIRGQLIDEIGYLNELFLRGVDCEFGCRASASGHTVGFTMWPHVHHIGHVTTGGDNVEARYVHQQARALAEELIDAGRLAFVRPTLLNARYHIIFNRADFSLGG